MDGIPDKKKESKTTKSRKKYKQSQRRLRERSKENGLKGIINYLLLNLRRLEIELRELKLDILEKELITELIELEEEQKTRQNQLDKFIERSLLEVNELPEIEIEQIERLLLSIKIENT